VEIEDGQNIRNKAAQNPRNRTFPKSFERVNESREQEQEKEVNDFRNEIEDDPFYNE
jgi:hypothetical protein